MNSQQARLKLCNQFQSSKQVLWCCPRLNCGYNGDFDYGESIVTTSSELSSKETVVTIMLFRVISFDVSNCMVGVATP